MATPMAPDSAAILNLVRASISRLRQRSFDAIKAILPRTVFSLTIALSLTSWPLVNPAEGRTNATAPDSVTMRLDYVAWWSGETFGEPGTGTRAPRRKVGSLVARIAPGNHVCRTDSLVRYGHDCSFRLLRIVDSERVWIAFGSAIPSYPPYDYREYIGMLDEGINDSVLVSSVPRHFHTPSSDAGVTFELSVVRPVPPLPDGLVLTSQRGGPHIDVLLYRLARNSQLVALGRVVARRADHPYRYARARVEPVSAVTFVLEEIWAGSGKVGDTLAVWLPGASTVAADQRAVFFLGRFARDWGREGWWRLTEEGGFEVASGDRISGLGIDLRLHDFKERVLDAVRPTTDRFVGTILGRVVDAGTSAPIRSAVVEVRGTGKKARVDATGWFEIRRVPIGHQSIAIRAPGRGTIRAVIPVSDEGTDTLTLGLKRRVRR